MQNEITDENFKKQIIFLLNNSWTGRGDMYFPLQNSVNIEKRYIFKLKNFKYIFYKKDTVDTKRAILFMFLDRDGNNKAVIILKDFTIYEIDIECPYEYYQGTIFDVSYKPDEVCIYDTFSCCGSKINRITYLDRVAEAQTFKHNIKSSSVSVTITEYSESISVYDKNLKDTDEIFMIPNDLPIITGVNYSCFKWKPSNLITFSLLVKENNEDIELYSTMFKNEILFAKIHNSDINGKKYIDLIKSLDNYKNNCVIDANVNEQIEIISVNSFKTIPSTVRSIEKIIAIKQENLKLHDLDFN